MHGSCQTRLTDSVQKGLSRLLCGPSPEWRGFFPALPSPPRNAAHSHAKPQRDARRHAALPRLGVRPAPPPCPHGALIAAPFSRCSGTMAEPLPSGLHRPERPRDAAAVLRPPHHEGSGPGAAPSRAAALAWTWRAPGTAHRGSCHHRRRTLHRDLCLFIAPRIPSPLAELCLHLQVFNSISVVSQQHHQLQTGRLTARRGLNVFLFPLLHPDGREVFTD